MDASELKEYIGKTVNVVVTPHTSIIQDREYDTSDYRVDEKDEVIISLRKAVGGSPLRFWTPNSVGTMDYRPERVNVYIDKKDNGWTITRISNG